MGIEMRFSFVFVVAALSGLSCTKEEAREGMNAGECADGADNDGDGYFDCDDNDCWGSPDCDESDTDADSDTDSDTDTDSDADADSDTDTDTGPTEGDEFISEDEQAEVEEAIAEAEENGEWPDAGGAVNHYLPYAEGIHMGISQGTSCNNHTGSLEGSVDFTISGNYQSSHGIYAVASASGTVTTVRDSVTGFLSGSYGNYVIIRHPDSSYTLYAHLAYGHVEVSEGDEVCTGQPLGLIGDTGESYGEHLHYEQRDVTNVVTSPSFEDLDPVPSVCDACATSTHESGCYESENELVDCSGDACDVDGEITFSEVEYGVLDVEGTAEAAEGLDKWSLVVDSDTVTSEEFGSGPTSEDIDIEVAISSFEFSDGSHTLGLWVRDVDGCTGDAAVDAATINCDSEAYYQCYDGDVYYFNDCGTRGSRKVNCTSSEVCVDTSSSTAECSANCGNGSVDSGEDCDGSDLDGETCTSQGYDGGSLSCDSSCSFDVDACYYCGDGSVDSGEDCDGSDLDGESCTSRGYDGGSLSCDSSCNFDEDACYVCGDGNADSGEDCDGSDLDGESCTSRGYDGGSLSCDSSCNFDEDACYVCGDGNADSGEDCDGSDLDGETCTSLGYDYGSLSCTSSCTFNESGCGSYTSEDCSNGSDDDGDGDADCDDSDCMGDSACSPTISSVSCTSYERGASTTCTMNGTNFLGVDNVWIGCLDISSASLSSDTRIYIYGDWECNCALDYQDVAYRHPGSSSSASCGSAYKACDTMTRSTTMGDAEIDSISPTSGYVGSSYSCTSPMSRLARPVAPVRAMRCTCLAPSVPGPPLELLTARSHEAPATHVLIPRKTALPPVSLFDSGLLSLSNPSEVNS
jgi:hypothetical protein